MMTQDGKYLDGYRRLTGRNLIPQPMTRMDRLRRKRVETKLVLIMA